MATRPILSKEEHWRKEFKNYCTVHGFIDNPELFSLLKTIHDEAWDQALYTWNNADR